MTEHHHFVHHVIADECGVRTKYTCTAPEDAQCRTSCETCYDEMQEQCICEIMDPPREPNRVGGKPCNILGWLENDAPDECYDGPETAVRGPEPQPIVTSWEGDYYQWRYAE